MPVQNRQTKVKRVNPLPKPDRPIVYPGVFPQLILQPILVRGVRPSSSEEVAEEVAEVGLRPSDVSPVEAEEVAEDVAEDVAEESRTVRTWVEDKRDTPVGPI